MSASENLLFLPAASRPWVPVAEGVRRQVLGAGDSFYIPLEAWHGVECLEVGVLFDVFSPARADFL